jgi:hypothetical protein
MIQLNYFKPDHQFKLAEVNIDLVAEDEDIKAIFVEFGNDPTVYVHHDGRDTILSGYLDFSSFYHQMNKFIHPIVLIQNEEQFEQFVDTTTYFNETTEFCERVCDSNNEYFEALNKVSRVVTLISNQKLTGYNVAIQSKIISDVLIEYEETSKTLSNRIDIRFANVTNAILSQKYKQSHCTNGGGESICENCLIIFKHNTDNEKTVNICTSFSNARGQVQDWITDNSMSTYEELTLETLLMLQMSQKVAVVAFTNHDGSHETEADLLKATILALSTDGAHINILYANDTIYDEVRYIFGIDWTDKPAIGLFDFTNDETESYAKGRSFEYDNVLRWLESTNSFKNREISHVKVSNNCTYDNYEGELKKRVKSEYEAQ